VAATSSDYITVDQLKLALNISKDTFDDLLQLAVSSSSRQIDNWYGDQFWTSDVLEQRVLRPDTYIDVRPGVFWTTEGLVVETDMDGDGTFEVAWADGDWQAEPTVPMFGYPHDRIISVGQLWFPAPIRHNQRLSAYDWGIDRPPEIRDPFWGATRRARVRITAKWGWSAVPLEVAQACQILASDHYKSKDLTNGSAGISGYSGGKNMLVQPPFNPLALKLLCHLRDPILA
jgi:hypothetical protein